MPPGQQSSARRALRASSPQRLICSRRTAYFPAAVPRHHSPPSNTCTCIHHTCIHIYASEHICTCIHLHIYARSTNSDSFLYFVHEFPSENNKSDARSTNLNEFLYFAHKYWGRVPARRYGCAPAVRYGYVPAGQRGATCSERSAWLQGYVSGVRRCAWCRLGGC